MIDASKGLKEWRNAVTREARKHCDLQPDADIYLRLMFLFARPKNHFNKRGVKPNAPLRPRNVDVDKLARAVCDALTGVAYKDDRQICVLLAERQYTETMCEEGVFVDVVSLAPCMDVG
jgi:crossover junction endodeoxyribonuclease RusA